MKANTISVEELLSELPRLRALARALVGEALADDLAQEAMRIALERAPDRPVPAGAWLHGIARNLARGQWRAEGRRRAREERVARLEAEEEYLPAERSESIALLGRALASLPEAERALLMARFMDGNSPRSMAAGAGVPATTMRARLSRALSHLRARMIELGGSAEAFHGIAAVAALPHGVAGVVLAEQALRGGAAKSAGLVAAAVVAGGVGVVAWQAARPGAIEEALVAETPRIAGTVNGVQEQEPDGNPGMTRKSTAAFTVHVKAQIEPGAPTTPLADVDVWWIPEDRLQGFVSQAAVMRQGRIPADILNESAYARSGADGSASFLEAPAGPYFLWAEGPRVAAFEGPLRASTSADLTVEAANWIQVEVLNHAGLPAAGVILALAEEGTKSLLSTGADLRTDANGLARIPLGIPVEGGELEPDQRLQVSAKILGQDSVVASAGTAAVPQPFVSLRLPPVGAIRIRVPEEGPQDGYLLFTRSGTAEGLSIHSLKNGEVMLSCVALHAEFDLTLTLENEGGVREKRVVGPVDPGQIQEVIIDEDEGVFLAGQVLDTDGRPLRPRKPWIGEAEPVTLVIEGWGVEEEVLELDKDGRFRLGLGLLNPDVEDELRVRLRYDNEEAVLAAPVIPKPGTNELGTLQLGTGPLLCAGVVIDQSGNPVPEVLIRVEHAIDKQMPEPVWVLDPVLKQSTNAVGEFRHRAVPRGIRSRIRLESPEWVMEEPVEFDAGATKLQVRVGRAGAVEANWLLPEDAPVGAVRAALMRADLEERHRISWVWAPEGHKRWESLDPGEYRLEFTIDGAMEPFHAIEGVRVQAGGDCDDSRLARIDLRPFLQVASVQVKGPGGKSLEHLFVRFGDDIYARNLSMAREGDLIRYLTLAAQQGTLVVGGEDCFPAVIELGYGRQFVELEQARATRFLVDFQDVEADDFQIRLGVRLPKTDPLYGTVYHGVKVSAFGSDGWVEHVIPPDREVLLQWQLYRRTANGWEYVRQRFEPRTISGWEVNVSPPSELFSAN